MKKILIVLLFFILAVLKYSSIAFAVTTSNSPTPTPVIDLQKQVDELKNKIASRVAQLNLVEKRGIFGLVTDSTDTQITLKSVTSGVRFIDVDELTKFSSSETNSFGISDIKKGMTLSVIGLYNKESQRTQAREINQDSPLPNFIYGAVFSIDNKNFNFVIAKENGAKYKIEVETITKTNSYAKGILSKSGFSKITVGEPLIVIGYFDKQDPNQIIASRIILFPLIKTNSKIDLNVNLPTIIPSTGSGKKLTPIVH